MHAEGKKTAGLVARAAAAASLAALLATGVARADPRDDFLARRSRTCQKCDLAGANFKRRDLTGVNLAGANLNDATFHDFARRGRRQGGE